MKITVAKTAGFCWGVKRAIDKVMELRNQTDDSIQTFGPLIHNPQILERLEERGIKTSEKLEEVSSKIVVVRTHGIPPEERNQLKEKDTKIVDTTCPDVAKIHARIKRSVRAGEDIIIAGHQGHPEIKGIMGYALDKGHLVEKVEDVAELPDFDKVGLVSQSTFNKTDFADISNAVINRWPEANIYNTICDATHDRQDEVRSLAKDVDVMIVIGGRASSNTKRLAEVGNEHGVPTYHIETEDELEPSHIAGVEHCGVTAGASTPDWIIERVVNRLRDLAIEQELIKAG